MKLSFSRLWLGLAGVLAIGMATSHQAQAAYSITTLGTAVTENFDGFNGNAAPANWTVTGQSAWRGQNNGSNNQNGAWSMGNGTDGSLGFLASGSATTSATAIAGFTNNSGGTITQLVINYDVELWRIGGRQSSFTVAISINGGAYSTIADLNYAVPAAQATGGTNGVAGSGAATAKAATLTGLNIAAGDTFEIRWIYSGDGAGGTGARSGIAVDNLSVTATGTAPSNNNNSVLSAPSVAFNRVMQSGTAATQSLTISNGGSDDTTYSASGSAGISVTPGAGDVNGNGTTNVTVSLDRTTTGDKSGTITINNTADSNDGAGTGDLQDDQILTVTGTVVADRTVTGEAFVSGQKVLVGATLNGTVTLETSGDRNHFADVTVNAGGATDGSVTVAAGTSQLFDGDGDTTTRDVSGTWGGAGVQTGSINLSVDGEDGLVGQNAEATVTYNVHVVEAVSLVAQVNGGTPAVEVRADNFDLITIENEIASTGDLGDRAAAQVTSVNAGTSGFFFDGISAGTVISDSSPVAGIISLDATNKLNGDHSANVQVDFAYAEAVVGAGTVGSMVWAATGSVTTGGTVSAGQTLTGSALVGHTMNFSTQFDEGKFTTLETFGTVTGSDIAEISVAFNVGSPASNVFSDILSLDGTGSQVFILQLSYDVDAVAALGGDIAPVVGYLSGGQWVNAVDGFGVGSLAVGLQGYEGSFLAALGVSDLAGVNLADYLGAYGYDVATGKAWAIINHNSDFAVVAIPEPSTWALVGAGLAFVLIARRRRSVPGLK